MHSSAWANNGVVAVPGGGRRVAALLLGAVTVALIVAAAPRLPRLAQQVSLIPADDPYVRLDREITLEFGMANPVVWIVEARDGTVWTQALLARIQAVTREVFTIPGVIALDVVSLASPNLRDLRVTEDTLEPVYLMAQPPETGDAMDALRRRVNGDPNFRGTLVSEDGRAAMVVANFSDDADPHAVAAAALALRDRYSDAQGAVYVVGGPVLGALAPRAALPVAAGAVLLLGAGLLTLALATGARAALAATFAAALASLWTATVALVCGGGVLPWTAYALIPTAVAAAALAVANGSWAVRLYLAVALAMGFIALAVVAGAPTAAFGAACALGSIAAVVAGFVVRAAIGCDAQPASYPTATRWAGLFLVVVALAGVPRLRASFGMFGYGERYLPERAVADLRALGRHFPPPTALAVRFRGAPGFVASPDVLNAFDALAATVRSDPAVVRVLSLADLVKMVNRAFNENRDEFLTIPSEPGLTARYLALAYSPQFRRFVDRAFSESALWVYLSSDNPTDLGRVLATLQTQLAAHPVPGAAVDVVGGDGAVVLATARSARALAVGTLVFLLLGAAGAGVLCSPRTGVAALAGGMAAGVFATGAFGWLGAPIDLVSLPCLVTAVAAGTTLGALGESGRLASALSVMALLALAASFTGANVLGTVAAVLFAAPAVAAAVTQRAAAKP